jgi:hypothetical protein
MKPKKAINPYLTMYCGFNDNAAMDKFLKDVEGKWDRQEVSYYSWAKQDDMKRANIYYKALKKIEKYCMNSSLDEVLQLTSKALDDGADT